MNVIELFHNGDLVSKTVALLLLVMSVTSWVLIVLKSLTFFAAQSRLDKAVQAFWQAPDFQSGRAQVAHIDKPQWLSTMLEAVAHSQTAGLEASLDKEQYLTRVLRNALQTVLHQLQFGQIALATIGSTAPFVGLLGTVWGIYHALTSIGAGGLISIDKISAPVGEALIMTAIGLFVAIPAVLAYNLFGRIISRIEAVLEGFARDVRELMLSRSQQANQG